MGNNVVIIASWIIIGYTVLVILFGLVFAGVELSKEMSEKKVKQAEEREQKSDTEIDAEMIVNEVIHRLDQELKYGSLDEALSDTLETCVVRLKSLLPGEVQ